jgi:hypothetical protein
MGDFVGDEDSVGLSGAVDGAVGVFSGGGEGIWVGMGVGIGVSVGDGGRLVRGAEKSLDVGVGAVGLFDGGRGATRGGGSGGLDVAVAAGIGAGPKASRPCASGAVHPTVPAITAAAITTVRRLLDPMRAS